MPLASRMVCHGCGWTAPDDEPYPFRCRNAREGDDIDHLLTRQLDVPALEHDTAAWKAIFLDSEANPFLRYRELLHSYRIARAGGLSDNEFVAMVRRLDDAIAAVDGKGFRITPYAASHVLAPAIGLQPPAELWIKNETGNVSGSHKARHTMGIMIWLQVMEALGRIPESERNRPLAIASCGNAALGAAVVAKAAGRTLQVFIPTDADPSVVQRLEELGAQLHICPRHPGIPGDPTYHAFQEATAAGALPFTCQGNENGLTIEGGKTLGWEMVSATLRGAPLPNRLILQVGGGALGSAVIQALFEAKALGLIARLPVIDAVQTEACHPLERAWRRLIEKAGGDSARALELLAYAATHRHEFMWAWETPPQSIAHGILDDETYDWVEMLRGVVATGGRVMLVGEGSLVTAFERVHELTPIPVCHTGASGLAGLMGGAAVLGGGAITALLLTGKDRGQTP